MLYIVLMVFMHKVEQSSQSHELVIVHLCRDKEKKKQEEGKEKKEMGRIEAERGVNNFPRTADIFADGAEISAWQRGSRHHPMTKPLCFIDFVVVTMAS